MAVRIQSLTRSLGCLDTAVFGVARLSPGCFSRQHPHRDGSRAVADCVATSGPNVTQPRTAGKERSAEKELPWDTE
ncbi:hypothetical protein CRENBAI_013100 [Crenichthys baileyi]|uniref:Uncharacterized protein n=1 Tax=Crenichthys baileyi TaxID=28760 RepID=A0AAV9SBP1_9TELE